MNLQEISLLEFERNKAKHKAMLKKHGDKAINTIKKHIPEGYTLKEYLDELKK